VLPPPLVRRLVLAPVVVVFAVAFIVLSPALAILALTFGLAARSRPGRMRSLRLTCFALIWFIAETAALFVLLGLWLVAGFGGRLRTEPYQERHYRVVRWFLDVLYDGAERAARGDRRAGAHARGADRPARPADHRAQQARRAR